MNKRTEKKIKNHISEKKCVVGKTINDGFVGGRIVELHRWKLGWCVSFSYPDKKSGEKKMVRGIVISVADREDEFWFVETETMNQLKFN